MDSDEEPVAGGEVQEEPPHVGSPEKVTLVSGGTFDGTTIIGDMNIPKVVNKTTIVQQAAPDNSALPKGTFGIRSDITFDENNPISVASSIYPGVIHSNVTGDIKIACKILPSEEKYKREAQKYFSVPYHQNIIRRYSTDTFNHNGFEKIFIAMELCDINMQDFIKSQVRNNVPFESGKYISYGQQVATGLEFLHSHNIIVRDLKPSNLLLTERFTAIKITDFGLSKSIRPAHDLANVPPSHVSADGWRAPEDLLGESPPSKASDVFSLALILYFFWSHGKHPYGDKSISWNHYISRNKNRDLTRLKIQNADSAKQLLESMLQVDPTRRPTASEVLQSQVFSPRQEILSQPLVSDSDLQNVISEVITQIQQSGIDSNRTSYQGNLCFTPQQLRSAIQSAMDEKNLVFTCESVASWELNGTTASERVVLEEETVPKNHSPAETSRIRQPSRRTQPSRRSRTESLGDISRPLCSNGFKIILVGNLGNKDLEDPCWKLVSEIYNVDDSRRQEYQDKGKVIVNTAKPNDVEELQKHFLTMGYCEEGIKCVVFAHTGGSHIVASALQENSLTKFFRGHDRAEVIPDKIKKIRNNLVVFTFRAKRKIINDNAAKIAINIYLTTDKTREFGKTNVEEREGENVRTVSFCHDNKTAASLCDFTNNKEVLKYIKKTLRRDDVVHHCSQYGNL
uniref:leucine-rich repeat serine/threonine-protein kinase 2-like isoform X1 n=1 Tax=Styela clava TaxID=7725 RepID=UPI001939F960|nr:leucine-rich repeat serine/threonine-protein kinase 2-like isoform X1 [Styela clava]